MKSTIWSRGYAAKNIAFLMNRATECVIILAIFCLFRQNAGGYHAKTRVGCYVFSCAMIIVALLVIDKQELRRNSNENKI